MCEMYMALHQPPGIRGDSDFVAPGMSRNTCHSEESVAYETGEGSIPGHSPWQLGPVSMGWIGKSAAEICARQCQVVWLRP